MFSRHSKLNAFLTQNFDFPHNLSCLEARHPHGTDQKRPVGLMFITWVVSGICDVMVVDSVDASSISVIYFVTLNGGSEKSGNLCFKKFRVEKENF